MSNNSSNFDRDIIVKLKAELTVMKNQDKFNEYCINHLKAEIRLLRDTLTKIQTSSKDCLYMHEGMNEKLEMQLERGTHMNHKGDEIKYVGESDPTVGEELKRKR